MFKPKPQAIRFFSHAFIEATKPAVVSKAEESFFNQACKLIEQCRYNILLQETQYKAFEAVEQLKKLDTKNISQEEKAKFEQLCCSNARRIMMNRHGEEPALEILGVALKIIPDSEKVKTLVHGIATDFYGNEKIQKRYLEIGRQLS